MKNNNFGECIPLCMYIIMLWRLQQNGKDIIYNCVKFSVKISITRKVNTMTGNMYVHKGRCQINLEVNVYNIIVISYIII
jgi:hypothetical protein